MQYRECDKCGKRITENDGVMAFFSTEKSDKPLFEFQGEFYYQINLKYDLCEECLGRFHQWIETPIESPDEEQPSENTKPDDEIVDGDEYNPDDNTGEDNEEEKPDNNEEGEEENV